MLEQVPGTRVGNETATFIPAEANIRCLRDHIVVEPLDWKPSKTISVVYTGKPLRGRVLARGPGHFRKIYDGPKGKRTKAWDSRYFTPSDIQVGNIVELGGLELRGYLFTTVLWGTKEVVICRESDVAIVIEGENE